MRVIAPAPARVVATVPAGVSARKELVHREAAARPRPPQISHAKPIWDLPVGGQGAGAGNKSGAGSLGTGATGSGTGDSGNGSGAGGGTEPCGYVSFADIHGSQYDKRTGGFWVDIRMTVHYPDGTTQSTILDYPFYYASEALNPWSQQNRMNPDLTVAFQAPPPDLRPNEPAVVQYVMAHTSREGYTLLKDCPGAPPNP